MRAGAIQLNATDDTDRNLQTADRLVRQAASLGAERVALPGTWTVLGGREVIRAGVQDLDGEAITWARSVAAEGILDPEGRLREVRRRLPALAHRRLAAYAWGQG